MASLPRVALSPFRRVGFLRTRSAPYRTRIYGARLPSSFRPIGLYSTTPEISLTTKPSRLSRFLRFITIGVVFTTTGFLMATIPALPALSGLLTPPSDGDSLVLFRPSDPHSEEVDDFIRNHPVAQALRKDPSFKESRPHMKIPEPMRSHSLTGGTLLGPGKIVVPPLAFNEKSGKSAVALYYIGSDLCGHPGIVHGGCLATILDEGLARCCFAALPNKVGMTASLSITYKAPLPADSYVCLRATTTKVEGRKAWVEGRLESLVPEGETPKVYVEATALFIEPKQAATMARLYPAASSA